MIRPVFKAGMESAWLSIDETPPFAEALQVFPNPSRGNEISVVWPCAGEWMLVDLTGREVANGRAAQAGLGVVRWSDEVSDGMMILRHLPSGGMARILVSP